MPVQFWSLPFHINHAQVGQNVQAIFNQAVANQAAVAADQLKTTAREEATEQVQDTKQSELQSIQGESRGSHSHTLPERKAREAEEPELSDAPDPEGRGKTLDIRL